MSRAVINVSVCVLWYKNKSRPKKTWNDAVVSSLKAGGLIWNEEYNLVKDKKILTKFTYEKSVDLRIALKPACKLTFFDSDNKK